LWPVGASPHGGVVITPPGGGAGTNHQRVSETPWTEASAARRADEAIEEAEEGEYSPPAERSRAKG